MPTVPTTPNSLMHGTLAHDPKRRALVRQVLRIQSSPVPIIAPPKDHMPRLPLSEEVNAKMRLERLLEKERRAREVDGLEGIALGAGMGRNMKGEGDRASGDCGDEDTSDDGDNNRDGDVLRTPDNWEVVLGVGKDLRREVIQWILEVNVSLPSRCCLASC